MVNPGSERGVATGQQFRKALQPIRRSCWDENAAPVARGSELTWIQWDNG